MKPARLSIFILTLFTSASCLGQNIDSLLKQRVDFGETPGIVVGVYTNGKTTYYTQGYANLETKEKVSSKTLFEIGSITKTFTTLLAALMVENGKWSLDDPIQKFLPAEVKMPQETGNQITVENLATARSGLPRMPGNFAPGDPQNPYIDYTSKQLFEFLNQFTLKRKIGSSYEYSNLGMGLLGYAITVQNHESYGSLVADWITRPLKMDQTFLNTPDRNLKSLARGYSGKNPVKAWTWTDQSVIAGAGGIISNAEDMIKYLRANLDESPPLGKALALTHVARHDAGSEKMQIGLGWHILNNKIIWHNGGTGGFRTFAGFNPQTKSAVVVLTNSNTGADDLGFYLLDASLPLKVIRIPVSVSEKILADYLGEYEMSPQFKITVTLKDGSLYGQATAQEAFELFPESENKFFLKGVDAQVEFVKNEKGKVEKLLLHQNGSTQGAVKIR